MTTPFRWNLARREQLGSLAPSADAAGPLDPDFLTDLRAAAARVLAFASDADLAFVGRTPENFFDYLSGVLLDVDSAPGLHLLQFSLRWAGEGGVESIAEGKRKALFDYFAEEGIGPAAIAAGPRRLALVDFVAWGGTMGNLVRLLRLHAARDGVDWNAVQRKLVLVGLRVRTKNSPNTWRWQQHQDWLDLIPDAEIKNVSAPAHFLFHLANDQPKVTAPFGPWRWGDDKTSRAPNPDQLEALTLAVNLFDAGRSKEERRSLAALIAQEPQMRLPAARRLVSALKRAPAGG